MRTCFSFIWYQLGQLEGYSLESSKASLTPSLVVDDIGR